MRVTPFGKNDMQSAVAIKPMNIASVAKKKITPGIHLEQKRCLCLVLEVNKSTADKAQNHVLTNMDSIHASFLSCNCNKGEMKALDDV